MPTGPAWPTRWRFAFPSVDRALFRKLAPLIVSDRYPTKVEFARTLPDPLPDEILFRAKSGFRTPVQQWIFESSGQRSPTRGLRDWARRVLPPQPRMFRALALVTDAFGGAGGIAKFNRDLLASTAAMADCAELVVIPRLILKELEPIPPRIKFVASAARGKTRFVIAALREALAGRVDLVIGGHINLAPLTALVAWLKAAPSMLMIHGIDAWKAHRSALVRRSLASFDYVVGVSNVTLERFASWSKVEKSRTRLLPNCVDTSRYGPGSKPAALADGLRLTGRTVIMTLGRLANEERYKGFDEVMEAIPALVKQVPNVTYLICGDGPDRARLEAKAQRLGVGERVVFTGFIPESRKADYYRLADAYVMPSQGEGFGIVFLEALACGIPVMGSRIDGGREALLDGELGILVSPSDAEDTLRGILNALGQPRGVVPDRLDYYSWDAFTQRAHGIVRDTLRARR